MLSFVKYVLVPSSLAILWAIGVPTAFAQPLAPLPGQAPATAIGAKGREAANSPTEPTGSTSSAQQLYEHVRRGVAAVERAGVPLAIGTVLGNDGRILTARSGLGGAEGVDVRYADGTTVHARLGHADKVTDLALLIPVALKWTDGLQASEADPAGIDLRAMLPARGGRLGPTEAGVRGRVDAHARDGEPLMQMLDVDVRGPLIAGAPLLDSTGSVVGVLVRACKGAASESHPADASGWAEWSASTQAPGRKPSPPPCAPAILGAPVATIRSFLAKTPTGAAIVTPWLGIRGETEASGGARGVRVVAVAPQSPAEKSGLRPGADVIVAVDGQPIDSPERLAVAIGKHAAGDVVKLLVFGQDKFREVAVALRAAP